MEILNPNTLEKMIAEKADITIIDVRTEEEFAEGIIEGAHKLNLFNPDFMTKIDEFDKAKTYVMVCRSGGRSGQACMQMMGLGFEKVYNLEGGMMSWKGATI
ncbi:MAG: rhodanese-like domain-containing protein [Crocinitomicaceae bacterium]